MLTTICGDHPKVDYTVVFDYADAPAIPAVRDDIEVFWHCPRRAMPLANVAWFAVFNWANPTVTRLEDQSVTPLFNDHPIELGLNSTNDKFLKIVATDPIYVKTLSKGVPGRSRPLYVR